MNPRSFLAAVLSLPILLHAQTLVDLRTQGAGLRLPTLARVDAQTLSFAANCSAAQSCNVRFGSLVYQIIAPSIVKLAAGTGRAMFYMDAAGTITVGNDLALSCSPSCFAVSPATDFPPNVIPFGSWSANNGAWDVGGGTDWLAFLNAKVIHVGPGLFSVEAGGTTYVAIDRTTVGLRAAVPLSSSASCTAGDWADDASFHYVCVKDDVWRRAALASF